MQNSVTRVFAIGDVIGRCGRNSLMALRDQIERTYHPDILLVNGENAAGGFGITKQVFRFFIDEFGASAVTTGNHWHDKHEVFHFYASTDQLVLPANMSNVQEEKRGLKILKAKNGETFAIMNLIGQAFMRAENRHPFTTAERLFADVSPDIRIRIVDMHAEATSEKQAMGFFLDGRVSLVYGTHSHVPTADERILPQGTGFITDLGATGAYDSIVGMEKELVLVRMLTGEKVKLKPAMGEPWLCALYAEINSATGLCQKVERIRWHVNEFV